MTITSTHPSGAVGFNGWLVLGLVLILLAGAITGSHDSLLGLAVIGAGLSLGVVGWRYWCWSQAEREYQIGQVLADFEAQLKTCCLLFKVAAYPDTYGSKAYPELLNLAVKTQRIMGISKTTEAKLLALVTKISQENGVKVQIGVGSYLESAELNLTDLATGREYRWKIGEEQP